MPIDYRIPYEIGSQRSKIIDPATLASLREKVAARQQDQLLANQKYEADQQELQRTNMLRQLLPKAVAADTSGAPALVPEVAGQYMALGGSAQDLRALLEMQGGAQFGATSPTKIEGYMGPEGTGTLLVSPGGKREFFPTAPKPERRESQQRAPAGYRYKDDGTLEPIPGGPAAGGGIGGKPPTESQQKFSLYSQTLGDALPSLNQLYATGYKPSAAALKLVSLDPTAWSTSGLMQGMGAADLEWVSLINNVADSIVRPRSGAAITAGDVANTISGYVPLPSESPETRKRKMANLEKQRIYLQNIAEGRTAGSAKPSGSQPATGKKSPSIDLEKLIPR